MKKLKFLSGFIFLLVIFGACNQEPAEMIIGEWKVSDFTSTADFDESDLNVLKKELVENEKYIFYAGKLLISYNEVDTDWIWKMSKKGTKLLIVSKLDSKKRIFKVLKQTKSKIVIEESIFNEHFETRTLEKTNSKTFLTHQMNILKINTLKIINKLLCK